MHTAKHPPKSARKFTPTLKESTPRVCFKRGSELPMEAAVWLKRHFCSQESFRSVCNPSFACCVGKKLSWTSLNLKEGRREGSWVQWIPVGGDPRKHGQGREEAGKGREGRQ